jgi:hypothetical protein
MEEQVQSEMVRGFEELLNGRIENLFTSKPESVYTYLQNESADELVKKPIMLQFVDGSKLIDEEDDGNVGCGVPDAPETSKKKGFFGRFLGGKK